MYAGATTISDENRQNVHKALDFLNMFLEGNNYVTGSEEPTLADVVIFVSVTNVVVSLKYIWVVTMQFENIQFLYTITGTWM